MTSNDTPSVTHAPGTELSGIYVVSVRREDDRESLRAAAYTQTGLSVGGVDADAEDPVTLPVAFTHAGYTATDLRGLIEGLHALATNPTAVGVDVLEAFGDRGGVDSEGHATSLFMFSLGGRSEHPNWLAYAEAAHDAWPQLFPTLGVHVGGQVFHDADIDNHRRVDVPQTRVPKPLRLKAGWDYDAAGNQVWLGLEEAWRRFVDFNDTRPSDDEWRLDAKTMRKMRRHMEDAYAGRDTTRP